MKRTTIILLTIAIALMAGTSVDAKTKARKSKGSNSAVPSVDFIIKLGEKISWDPTKVKEYAGIKRIGKNIAWENERWCGVVYFGKNTKVSTNGNNDKITATGPHAWYVSYCWDTDHAYCIAFKSKADCDAFWNKYKNSQYVDDFNRENWRDFGLPISINNNGWHEIYLDDH